MMIDVADTLASQLENYCKSAAADGYVVGLSGGVDSTVAARLAVMGCGKRYVKGLILPLRKATVGAVLAAGWLDIDYEIVEIAGMVDSLTGPCTWRPSREDRGNIMARVRMILLYSYANAHNHLVLGTGNKTELALGYFTKYGDGGVDILPLGNLYKYQVYELAVALGVPKAIVEAVPSAGLWEDQADELEIGASYEQIDAYLQGGQVPSEVEERLAQLVEKARHKLSMPPILRVSGVRDDK